MDMKFLINMTGAEEKELRRIALEWGFVLDRSQRKGEGNVAQLVRAVAQGKMTISPASPNWKNGNQND